MFLSWRYEARRRRLLKRAPPGPLHDYLNETWPALNTAAHRLPLLALDLETSGLNPLRDEIVSIGWVLLDEGRISLSSAQHFVVKPKRALPAPSVVVHGIGDDRAATGLPIRDALSLVLKALSGRILLGHHIAMDAAFLAAACRGVNWGELAMPCVDTLAQLERAARLSQTPVSQGAFTLAQARSTRALPAYPAHNALWDAIAAAELWLAQSASSPLGKSKATLEEVVRVLP